jgi:hypothetical protein
MHIELGARVDSPVGVILGQQSKLTAASEECQPAVAAQGKSIAYSEPAAIENLRLI